MAAVWMPIPRFRIPRWRYTFTALVLTTILLKEVTSQLSNASSSTEVPITSTSTSTKHGPCTNANGGCDQLCIAINATDRRCECGTGLFLDPNGTSCVTKPLQKNKFLLMTDKGLNNTFQIDVDTGEVRALTLDKGMSPTAMTYDSTCNCFYWFDSTNERIMKTVIGNSYSEILINVSGSDITTLAIDTVSRTLFYTDRVSSTIMHLSLLSPTPRVFMSEAGSRPRTMFLDTYSRLIYWSECERNTIQRSSIANSTVNRTSLVPGVPNCVTAFAVDITNRVLLAGDDSGAIGVSYLDGGQIRQIVIQDPTADYTGMTFDDRFIYIADTNKRQITRRERQTNLLTILTGDLFTQPYALLYNPISGPTLVSPPSTSITTTTPKPSLVTTILASVFSGAVVLIAIGISVTIIVIVAKTKRNREQEIRPTPPDYGYRISVYDEIADDDGTYTEPVVCSSEGDDSLNKKHSYSALIPEVYDNIDVTRVTDENLPIPDAQPPVDDGTGVYI